MLASMIRLFLDYGNRERSKLSMSKAWADSFQRRPNSIHCWNNPLFHPCKVVCIHQNKIPGQRWIWWHLKHRDHHLSLCHDNQARRILTNKLKTWRRKTHHWWTLRMAVMRRWKEWENKQMVVEYLGALWWDTTTQSIFQQNTCRQCHSFSNVVYCERQLM